ncbi:hypothetical protein [Pinirhizobacter soli]|uniref:hypothetical protein n=1 Tax=Pinirhizobacter soli TaxID=2786953 RepID=UPI002029E4D7|nr:hypothetical protein [Pinirhizobacter soli]
MEQAADSHGNQADEGERNGGFQPATQVMVQVATREGQAQHDGEYGRAGFWCDRQGAGQGGQCGQYGDDGRGQGLGHAASTHGRILRWRDGVCGHRVRG